MQCLKHKDKTEQIKSYSRSRNDEERKVSARVKLKSRVKRSGKPMKGAAKNQQKYGNSTSYDIAIPTFEHEDQRLVEHMNNDDTYL